MTENKKRLEYLDLARSSYRYITTLDKEKLVCFDSQKSHKHTSHNHTLYSDNPQLNSVIDLLFLILNNMSVERGSTSRIVESFLNLFHKKNNELKEIKLKLDFLKQQTDLGYLRKLPTRTDIETLIAKVDEEPKKIELETKTILETVAKEVDKIKALEQSLFEIVHKIING